MELICIPAIQYKHFVKTRKAEYSLFGNTTSDVVYGFFMLKPYKPGRYDLMKYIPVTEHDYRELRELFPEDLMDDDEIEEFITEMDKKFA